MLIVLHSETLNRLELSGPVQVCTRTVVPSPYGNFVCFVNYSRSLGCMLSCIPTSRAWGIYLLVCVCYFPGSWKYLTVCTECVWLDHHYTMHTYHHTTFAFLLIVYKSTVYCHDFSVTYWILAHFKSTYCSQPYRNSELAGKSRERKLESWFEVACTD